ncbi:MAG: NADH:ubiquinone reductase (Na(+)-transporting) subunit B [Bacteroidales bacterium]|nr:NADH:ubiquinone reductase (Na(+)-transporting) subunit B [Bacteroidales bacterium]MDE7356904.1 NADH:ubiquinone reductase (Na(+)-transporting) subunit B [Bacteroidales bacterium]
MLRNFIDRIKPNFEKGGKWGFLHSTFEAFETFLFVPNEVTRKGSHVRDAMDMKRTMIVVVLALIPCLLFGTYNVGRMHFGALGEAAGFWRMFGFGALKVLPMLVVSYVVGLGIEFIFAQVRGHQVNEGFLVSGLLIPMICPPDVPLWMLAVATAFAVLIGKEVFGGTGMNIWNPALLARAFLFFAYPSQMSGDSVWVADAVSGPTALSMFASGNMEAVPSIGDLFWGFVPGSVGETSAFCILLGAFILLWTGIGSFRIMFSVLVGGILMIWTARLTGATDATIAQHLLSGGFLFGMVFMATDPVTSAQTRCGKLIYGFLLGVMAMLIRICNPAYPEGMMLAILLMNTFAPLIDYGVVNQNIRRRRKRMLKAEVAR